MNYSQFLDYLKRSGLFHEYTIQNTLGQELMFEDWKILAQHWLLIFHLPVFSPSEQKEKDRLIADVSPLLSLEENEKIDFPAGFMQRISTITNNSTGNTALDTKRFTVSCSDERIKDADFPDLATANAYSSILDYTILARMLFADLSHVYQEE